MLSSAEGDAFLMLKKKRGRQVSLAASALTTVSALVVALLNPGVHTAEVELNDGGVWVTNANLRLTAHVNYPARVMDSGLRAPSSVFNVYQNGEEVFLSDAESSTLTPINVAKTALETPVEFSGLAPSIGGQTLALTDGAAGKVWIQNAEVPSTIDAEETEPDLDSVPGALSTVGMDGVAHVISPEARRFVSLTRIGEGTTLEEHKLAEGLDSSATIQISAVGDTPVVLDKDNETLYFADGTTRKLEGTNLALQEVGPHADFVLVASDKALMEVPLDGSEITSLPAAQPDGTPSRPVRHLGCDYSAWSVTGAFLRHCDNESENDDVVVDTLKKASNAVFRVNRDVIILNDVDNGGLWLPDQKMLLIDNWDQIESSVEKEDDSEEESPDETNETLLPERSETNTPPVAVDDELGVRAGRTNILPVLNNDSDIDGDFLTAVPLSQPSIGEVTKAREGSALQIAVPEGASGTGSFEYEISDGRGGTAKARVTLSVRDPETNEPPVQTLIPTVSLGQNRKATINALANWYDPDGDPFYLDGAAPPEGISARTHINGSIDLTSISHAPGKDSVKLFVSDGRDVGEGEIAVTVKEQNNEPPLANADHVVVREGSSATFAPMSNDSDPNGDPLRLVQIGIPPVGINASMDGASGSISVQGNKVGTYYLGYVITDGPSTGPGIIRIDVVPAETEEPPSAEPDLGVLPEGGQVLIDLLANDSDPSGGVLTVQKVDVGATSPLVVALVNNQLVRVSAPRGLSAPETFTYTVSNGIASASATVTVLPRPANTGTEPPELTDDQITVRQGDVASVAVLANDRSPAGLKLTVKNELQHEIKSDLGEVFISDNIVRVRGGSRAGSGKIIYTVFDSAGNVASAVVNLVVVGMNEETNTAPRPKDLTVRTIAGREVDVVIPLDNIDPEGDSVTLVGLGSAPRLGTVTNEGLTFRYRAAETSKGTDSFTYIVEDRLGKQATGTIRVGIAPAAESNQKPVALPDQVQVKPGTKVAVAVLSNDIDPDGDQLVLEKDSLTTQSQNLQLSQRAGRIVVVAPEAEGTHVISYGVSDRKGGSARGILSVIVRAQAPELAPIARDDLVTLKDVQGGDGKTVTIPVLANDEDPDGDIEDVTISSPDNNVKVNSDRTVTVTLASEAQILLYSITDATNKKASAVIRVPGLTVTRPSLNTTTVPIKVKAGVKVEIPLNRHIIARDGRSVSLTNGDKVSVGVGSNGEPPVKDASTLVFTALEDFSGPTSITVEVTDGKDVNDPEGQVAVVTLPIEVEPADNRPPTFTPTAIEVAPGEAAVSSNLAPMVTDPDKDDPTTMRYSIVNSPDAGLSASISGTTLSVSAPATAQRGSGGSIRIRVEDGRGGSIEGDVPVVIVSSSRPLIQTTPHQVTLDAGKSTTVDVAQLATNPFQDQGPITLVGEPSTGAGGSVQASGTTLNIAADAGFNGTFTVTYSVVDVTKDVNRHVQGTITATVRDKPGAPINASAVSNSAGTAQVSWTAGSANGTPITGFTVQDTTQGDSTECGLVTTCLIPGRKNGIEHTFVVTATNEVGVSDPSNGASTMIDIEPEAPQAPTVRVGDREVTVSWQPPHNEGSALTEYEVILSPSGAQTLPASTTSFTFRGLSNGAEYVATVRARNSKGDSPVSLPSAVAVPYGAPGPVSAIHAEVPSGAGSLSQQVLVTWDPPANTNGRAIERYTVSGGGVTRELPGTARNATLADVPYSSTPVVFTVTATNDVANAAQRTSTPAQATTWVVGRPPGVEGHARATGNDGEVQLERRSSGEPSNGWLSNELRLDWSVDGQRWMPVNGDRLGGNGLQNGVNKPILLRTVGTKAGGEIYSQVFGTNPVSPFGMPVTPNIRCSGRLNAVDCSWDGGSGNGRDATFTLSGAAGDNVGASGNKTFNVGEGQNVRLCIKATQTTDEAGTRTSGEKCAEAQSASYERNYSVDRFGGTHNIKGYRPTCNGCQWVRIKLWGYPPHSRVKCWTQNGWNGTGNDSNIEIQTNGDGYYHDVPPFFNVGIWAGQDKYIANVQCEGNRK